MATLTTTISYGEPAGSMVATLGAPGPSGQAATISVGSTTTGAPGSAAAVVNVGTSSAAVFDFTIPEGLQGDPGVGVPAGGAAGQILSKIDGVSYNTEWIDPSDIAAVWGQITGDLDDQLDLAQALDGKYDASNPAGFITASALSGYLTSAAAAATYYPLTNPDGYITSGALAGYATESWVTAGFYPLSANPAGYLTASALTPYLSKAGNLSGLTSVSTARSNLNLGSSDTPAFAGVDAIGSGGNASHLTPTSLSIVQAGSGQFTIQPAQGITFPDGSIQTTAFTGGASVSWGSITGTLSDQTDLYSALSAKYDASNPAGYIDSSALSGYATESWVQSQGYLTSVPPVVLTNLTTSVNWDYTDTVSTLYIDGVIVDPGSLSTAARLNFGITTPSAPLNGDLWFDGSNFRFGQGGAKTIASQTWVAANYYPLSSNPAGYLTSAALTPYLLSSTAASTYQTQAGMSSYAQLAGATFTGKVNAVPVNADSPSINIGSANSVPANAQNGDVWISNVASPKLAYKFGNNNYYAVAANAFNTFTGQVAITGTSASNPQLQITQGGTAPALRVTSTGAGHSIVIEDSTTPDTTATVVDASGNIGVGVDAATWTAANKVEIVGAVKAQSITFDGSAQFKVNSVTSHGTGANTHDLLISFNGSTYRIPMIFVSTP